MATGESNTFVEPTAGTAINTARGHVNTSLRAILRNFYSSVIPGGENIKASGSNIGEQDGMLFRMANANVNALYISDSVQKKTSRIGGNFTRVGLGTRTEDHMVALAANAHTYEIGELVTTVSANVSTASNARVYMSTANNGTMADFIDIGLPPTNGSITNTMVGVGALTADRVTFTNTPDTGNSAGNSQLKIGISSADANIALGFGVANTTSNTAIVKAHGLSGLQINDQTGKTLAPLRANSLFQASITGVNTNTSVLIPAGTIVMWGGDAAPSGWYRCRGGAISRTTYAALFAAIGTAYGAGHGTTTFGIPNFSNRFPLGATDSGASAIGKTSAYTLPSTGNVDTQTSTAVLSLGDIEVSTGAKDAGGVTVLQTATAGGHTHIVNTPYTAVNFIIKT